PGRARRPPRPRPAARPGRRASGPLAAGAAGLRLRRAGRRGDGGGDPPAGAVRDLPPLRRQGVQPAGDRPPVQDDRFSGAARRRRPDAAGAPAVLRLLRRMPERHAVAWFRLLATAPVILGAGAVEALGAALLAFAPRTRRR